ncbi:hypothetical protein BOW16_07255 [Solemya velum gill symbiont]|uniref:DUF3530 family protein n=2 Tax=Solemya velum gill symbiont TaxID=2340 RepID=UPI0009982856|nr:DUF3530 family protein [Solemya velum gill symbiont]OOY56698.1 hypothetical protein BOW00_06795 [Solemya velum gill symbiont]OOY59876.1 hypothetical protein BOW02_07345 [Solemya velum gill symbiont]OOY62198.1 hypothetical protein BOW04_07225 [Solemya velum gill symbiont]OOY64879.1 hypothetical protein BOW05_07660 [Solemya velum gill symbiont]OOY67137.1 hypothetical protein BOW06_07545 [Solemya velum gill symbiont]
MQGSVKLRLLCGFFLLLPSITIMAASDLEREQRLEDEIVDAILDGDPLDLPRGDGGDFLGIYTETDADKPKGAVIILHGRGYHPDWAYTVQPLRVGLIDYGWNTLSIQLPVLKKEAKYFDYVPIFPEAYPRIESAISYLKEQGNEQIVLIAHSCGAHMANFWLDDVGHENIDAYVGLGMGATDYQQPMVRDFPLDKLKIPVLDLYGEHDYPAVHRYAPLRKMMIEAGGNPKSSQQVLPEADHYFTYRGDELIEAVGNWLDTL